MFCSNRDVRKLTVNSPLLTCQQHIAHLLCVDRTGPANNIQWDIRRLFQCWNHRRLNANSLSFSLLSRLPIEFIYKMTRLFDQKNQKGKETIEIALYFGGRKNTTRLSRSSQGLGRTMCVNWRNIFWHEYSHTVWVFKGFFLRLTPISQRKVVKNLNTQKVTVCMP